MKLWVMSDLHVDTGEFSANAPDERPDLAVIAGDLACPLSSSIKWIQRNLAVPTVYIAGNSDFYGTKLLDERAIGRQLASEAGIHLLENDCIFVDGIRILGCTLWTDHCLYGNAQKAMRDASIGIMDYHMISTEAGKLDPLDTSAFHKTSRDWLSRKLSEPFPGKTIVVSHHAPHPRAIAPAYRDDALNPAFASDLTCLFETRGPELWVHGHVHASHDYRVGDTRIICNARGGASGEKCENLAFNPHLVIEI